MKRVSLKHGQDFTATSSGVEINKQLINNSNGGISQVSLKCGQESTVSKQNQVREIWYIVSGSGEFWSKSYTEESVKQLIPGIAVEIPLGVEFQYRSSADTDLVFTRVTMPKWPEVQRI